MTKVKENFNTKIISNAGGQLRTRPDRNIGTEVKGASVKNLPLFSFLKTPPNSPPSFTNISGRTCINSHPPIFFVPGASLDKLGDVRKVCDSEQKTKVSKGINTPDTLKKRARAKAVTNAMMYELLKLNSSHQKAYKSTLFCADILIQEGTKITAKYCKQRHCIVCNRIRTANLINGYMPTLQAMPDKHFLTLTIPNVRASELKDTTNGMIKTLSLIQDSLRKEKHKVKALRKLEVTYNHERNNFHPHFHLITETKAMAEAIQRQWLERYPSANINAQDIRQADDNSCIELFKYFTKLIVKEKHFHAESVDTILRSIRNKRIFQPIGIKKVSEEIEIIEAQEFTELANVETLIWNWNDDATDWCDMATGQLLTGYTMPPEIRRIFNSS